MAVLLVTAKPDLIGVQDKRGHLALDLLKSEERGSCKWSALLNKS